MIAIVATVTGKSSGIVTISTTVFGQGPWLVAFDGLDILSPAEPDFPDAKNLLSSGDFLAWLFWTRWQFELPRFRPSVFVANLRVAIRKRPRARARRHAPNHSPRRLCYAPAC